MTPDFARPRQGTRLGVGFPYFSPPAKTSLQSMFFSFSRATLFVSVLILAGTLSPSAAFAAEAPAVRPGSNTGMEELVREYFADIPVMIEIARCESQFKHYHTDGTVRKNHQGSSATGLMQIMASIHRKPATALGFDINTPEGNLAYARYLYEDRGLAPWLASKHCWNAPKAAARWQAATKAVAQVNVVAEAATVPEEESVSDGGEMSNTEQITHLQTQLVKILETITQMQTEQRVASAAL